MEEYFDEEDNWEERYMEVLEGEYNSLKIKLSTDLPDMREVLTEMLVTLCSNVERPFSDLSHAILQYDSVSLVFDEGDLDFEIDEVFPADIMLGLPFGEFVLRINNICRTQLNLGIVPPLEEIRPLDGAPSIQRNGTLSYLCDGSEGELIEWNGDLNSSHLEEDYWRFQWLDDYTFDMEVLIYNDCSKSGYESRTKHKWFDYDYMREL